MIYLDNAATTCVYPEVADIMKEYCLHGYFNASATYKPALKVRSDLSAARATIASFLGAETNEVFFTSCATESNNWAIKNGFKNKNGNIVISAGEHACVYESAKSLESKGFDVRIASMNFDGDVNIDDLTSKVDEKTCLVSVIHVSNETGVVNNLKAISDQIKRINPRVIFHSDGVQAFLKVDCNVKSLGVDMYSISGHKFHAPKGTGALYIDNKLHLAPYLNGGGQESGLRSGTENIAGIIGMAKAGEIFCTHRDNANPSANFAVLADMLNKIDGCKLIGCREKNSHYIAAASFSGCKAEILQSMLADEGLLIGRGSACSSRHSGNRVLSAMNLPQNVIDGTLRFSLSPETEREEIIKACKIVEENVKKLRGNNIG